MKLRDYLDLLKTNPFAWAKSQGLDKNGVYKALSGGGLKLKTAVKISQATKGAVRPEELL